MSRSTGMASIPSKKLRRESDNQPKLTNEPSTILGKKRKTVDDSSPSPSTPTVPHSPSGPVSKPEAKPKKNFADGLRFVAEMGQPQMDKKKSEINTSKLHTNDDAQPALKRRKLDVHEEPMKQTQRGTEKIKSILKTSKHDTQEETKSDHSILSKTTQPTHPPTSPSSKSSGQSTSSSLLTQTGKLNTSSILALVNSKLQATLRTEVTKIPIHSNRMRPTSKPDNTGSTSSSSNSPAKPTLAASSSVDTKMKRQNGESNDAAVERRTESDHISSSSDTASNKASKQIENAVALLKASVKVNDGEKVAAALRQLIANAKSIMQRADYNSGSEDDDNDNDGNNGSSSEDSDVDDTQSKKRQRDRPNVMDVLVQLLSASKPVVVEKDARHAVITAEDSSKVNKHEGKQKKLNKERNHDKSGKQEKEEKEKEVVTDLFSTSEVAKPAEGRAPTGSELVIQELVRRNAIKVTLPIYLRLHTLLYHFLSPLFNTFLYHSPIPLHSTQLFYSLLAFPSLPWPCLIFPGLLHNIPITSWLTTAINE